MNMNKYMIIITFILVLMYSVNVYAKYDLKYQFSSISIINDENELWEWGSKLHNGKVFDFGEKNYPIKILDNVIDCYEIDKQSLYIIDNDNTLFWFNNNMKNEITDNVKSVKSNRTLYVLKNDNTLWDYGEYCTDNKIGNKIANNVLNFFVTYEAIFIITTNNELYGKGNLFIHNLNVSEFTRIADNIKEFFSCNNYFLTLNMDGDLYAWGVTGNAYGLFADDVTLEAREMIKISTDVKSFDFFDGNLHFIKNDGTLWHCGMNRHNFTMKKESKINTPTKVTDDVKEAYKFIDFALVLKNNGNLYYYKNKTEPTIIANNIDYIINEKSIYAYDIPLTSLEYRDVAFFVDNNMKIWGIGNNKDKKIIDSEDEIINTPIECIKINEIVKVNNNEEQIVVDNCKSDNLIVILGIFVGLITILKVKKIVF